jgi:tetratricopeptide (TPR) repeat protein
MDLPMGLVSALESGDCVLFVGAGVGHHAQTRTGLTAPDARGLALSLASEFGIDAGSEPELAKVAQVVETRKGRLELIAFLKRTLGDLQPDSYLQWLMSRTWRAVFTTNYDGVLERCFELNPAPTQTPVSIGINSEVRTFDPNFQVPIYHLHGSLFSETAKDSILITEQDYALFRSQRQMLFDLLKYSYATSTILYFGYSNSDPNWRVITAELRSQFFPGVPPTGYRIAPETPDLDREILEGQRIFTLDGYLSDLREDFELKLGDLRVDPRRLETLSKRVPSDLDEVFDQSPAAVMRFLNSWEYVNQARFDDEANTYEFLRGNRANWALVGQGINFERDLENQLVRALLDFATDPNPRSREEIILAPAGYGLTTLLMAVTAWFAKSRSGTALFLRPGGQIVEADVEFAVTRLPNQPVVFFVDDAADHADEIVRAKALLQRLHFPGFIMMTERLNEWHQARSPLSPTEHELQPLSDSEIDKLIACLDAQGALGQLRYLSADLRISSIKYRNQQDLLVTMREATEGRAFDAIIESEFNGIASAVGKDLYSLVAIFSRLRALARDGLCSEALGLNLADLYLEPAESTEGIVIFDLIDESREIYAARTRHHIIADIVWRRCVDSAQNERLLIRALDSLNLTFSADSKAFERLTRDDESVDVLRGLEAKIRFFEAAIRKSPQDAYVRQHFARMLLREQRYDLALSQIQEAIDMSPRARVLYHTKGVILAKMALQPSVDDDIRRRRLAQSEGALRTTIHMDPRDDYGYSTLAELYLDWAQSVSRSSSSEAILYVTKAQETIFEGLRSVKRRESLYIVMSGVERYLGDEPGQITALRRALTEAPQSPVARYLLGTVLLAKGETVEAVEVLTEGVRLHSDHPRMAVKCAMAMYQNGAKIEECVAILNLTRTVGESDPYFVSVLAGMLVLMGKLSEADAIWTKARQRNFTSAEKERVYFTPNRVGHDGWMRGHIAHISPSYAFVKLVGYPDAFCRPKYFVGLELAREQSVEVKVGFTVRGPQVLDLRIA